MKPVVSGSSEDTEILEQHDDSNEQTFGDSVNSVCICHLFHSFIIIYHFVQFITHSNLSCSSSTNNSHDMTFLNNNNNNNNNNNAPTAFSTTTVLPDFQYLTSPSGDKFFSTATSNHIPIYSIPKSVDAIQYGNNITNNTNLHSNSTHVDRQFGNKIIDISFIS